MLAAALLVAAALFAATAAQDTVLLEPLFFTEEDIPAVEATRARAQALTGILPLAIPSEMVNVLADHNSLRATHQAPALVWSDTLAASSQTWADKCIWAHSGLSGVGENLAGSSTTDSVGYLRPAVAAWYKEIDKYDFKNPGFTSGTGHFTQVVWKNSANIGCAYKLCPNGMSGAPALKTILVCQYTPPGNFLGQFAANVLPAATTSSPSPTPGTSPSPTPGTSPSPSPNGTTGSSPSPGTSPSPGVSPLPGTSPAPGASASPGVSPSPVAPCAANACGAKVAARNNLGAGSCLVMNKAGNSVCARSSDKRYFFCIQNDAEVALYDKGQRIWAAGVAGASTKRPFRLCLEKTGALVAYEQVDKKTRRSYWSSQSSGAKPLKFWVQTTGVAEILSGKNTKKTTATTVWKVPTTP